MKRRKWIPREEWLAQYDDPLWQKKRLKIMEYARFRCQGCGTRKEKLNVHHSYYLPGKKVWQHPDCSLLCLCWLCHQKLHGITDSQIEPPKVVPRTVEEQFQQFVESELAAQKTDPPKPASDELATSKFSVIFDMLGKL